MTDDRLTLSGRQIDALYMTEAHYVRRLEDAAAGRADGTVGDPDDRERLDDLMARIDRAGAGLDDDATTTVTVDPEERAALSRAVAGFLDADRSDEDHERLLSDLR